MRLAATSLQFCVGAATGLTSGGIDSGVGSTVVGQAAFGSHMPRRAQLSNGTFAAVEQAFRNSACVVGVPAKQPSGPSPDATHTPCSHNGWPPKRKQSSSVLHCAVERSSKRLQPLVETTNAPASAATAK